jgi:two-component system, response regulator PdtaR
MLMAVLIVEDEPLVRLMMVDTFEELGFDVVEAATSLEAMALLDKPHICGLVTDIELPGAMNGLELAHVVRGRLENLAIFICSGRVLPPKQELPADARFFAKPLRKEDLTEIADEFRRRTQS